MGVNQVWVVANLKQELLLHCVIKTITVSYCNIVALYQPLYAYIDILIFLTDLPNQISDIIKKIICKPIKTFYCKEG